MRNFDIENLQLKEIFLSSELNRYKYTKFRFNKIKDIFSRDILFENYNEQYPIILGSFVMSVDGKIAFNDVKKGCPVANANYKDPRGANIDFWIMMMLRALSDAIIIGNRTLQDEPNAIGIIYDKDLATERSSLTQDHHPTTLLFSNKGNSIPYDHRIFELEVPVIIITTQVGSKIIADKLKSRNKEYIIVSQSTHNIKQEYLQNKLNKIIILICGAEYVEIKDSFKILKTIGFDVISSEASTITHNLIESKLLHEMFCNYSGIYIGGNANSIASNEKAINFKNVPQVKMLSIHMSSEHFFFMRQKFIYS